MRLGRRFCYASPVAFDSGGGIRPGPSPAQFPGQTRPIFSQIALRTLAHDPGAVILQRGYHYAARTICKRAHRPAGTVLTPFRIKWRWSATLKIKPALPQRQLRRCGRHQGLAESIRVGQTSPDPPFVSVAPVTHSLGAESSGVRARAPVLTRQDKQDTARSSRCSSPSRGSGLPKRRVCGRSCLHWIS